MSLIDLKGVHVNVPRVRIVLRELDLMLRDDIGVLVEDDETNRTSR
jgi:hypothetical protein